MAGFGALSEYQNQTMDRHHNLSDSICFHTFSPEDWFEMFTSNQD